MTVYWTSNTTDATHTGTIVVYVTGTVTTGGAYGLGGLATSSLDDESVAAPSLYQRRRDLSLAAIARHAREARRIRPICGARPRKTAPFAKRTCSIASRWMVLQ